jgi:hypothetical protein
MRGGLPPMNHSAASCVRLFTMSELKSILCAWGLTFVCLAVMGTVMYHVSYRRHLAEANMMLAPLYAELERGRAEARAAEAPRPADAD